jgi:antitoxin component of MazEF toxin-antitoxin module
MFIMKKIIKQWGNSLVIRFNPEEVKTYDLHEGDILELEDLVKIKKKGAN